MVLIALIVCGTGYGIWRIQTSEDHLVPSASVQKVEKKQQALKPAGKLTEKQNGFAVRDSIKVGLGE